MQHALAVGDLVVALEQLAADAVPALVTLLVEVVGRAFVNALDECLHSSLVVRSRRPPETVVRDRESLPHPLEAARDLVDELLRRQAALRGGLRDLLPVLV